MWPDGSASRVPENRWPPRWVVSQVASGHRPARAAATGRPISAQQRSRRPLVQTSQSGPSYVVRSRSRSDLEQRLGVGQQGSAHDESLVGGAGVEDAHAGPGDAAVTSDQLHAHAVEACEVGAHPLGQPALGDGLAAPRPGVLDEQELGVRRGSAADRLPVVPAGDGAAEVVHRSQSAVHPRSRPHPRPADGPVRAARCAARSPPPRCGRPRRAWPGCWRRGPTPSWWR